MKQLHVLARAQRGRYYVLTFTSLAIAVLIILQAYAIVSVIDHVFIGQTPFQQVVPLLGALLTVLLLRVAFTYWHGRTGVRMATKVKQDYRQKILQTYKDQSLLTSYSGQAGQKVSVLMDAVDELDGYFSKYVPQRILASIVPLVILIVIFSQHWVSGLILLVTAPFIPIFMAIIGKATQKKAEEQLDSLAAFSGRFLDTLQGLVSLKFFGRSKQQKEVIRKSSLNFREATMGILKVAFTSALMLEFISMLSIGLVALELGLRLVVFDQISFYTAFFILLLVPEFFTQLKDLGSAFHAGRSSQGAAEKVEKELERSTQQVAWGEKDMRENELAQKQGSDKRVQRMPTTPPELDLKNIHFQYGVKDGVAVAGKDGVIDKGKDKGKDKENDGEQEVKQKKQKGFALRGIRATIPAGGQVAIVGKSGAGKTTLLHILAGLVMQTAGDIMVNGRPRQQYCEQQWFSQVSYISQHPYLFAGTIADNIALGLQNQVTQADIERAAEKAGIDTLVRSLKNGYNTYIGEAGRGLSGGEKQRIALARAFLKKPSLILFDEPTTGLDLFTEQKLQQSIQELAKTATVVTVAHRLHTIQHAQQVLFLANGQLIGQGTHEQLRATLDDYKELFAPTEEDAS